MNYSNFIVKLITLPEQSFFEAETSLIEIIVQFSENDTSMYIENLQLSLWGNLGYDFKNHYQINDYILIEGSLSFIEKISKNYEVENEIEFTINRVYPLTLKSNSLNINSLNSKKNYKLPF
jgi:hypothetical protein